MAKFKVNRKYYSHVTIMLPRGGVIGTTDKKGEFETEDQEHIEILTTDPRYIKYITPVDKPVRRTKKDAAESEGENV